ncbi:MAG: cytochrome c biogenesis CcdA family protein, partial [Gemmatimonadales bacterium]
MESATSVGLLIAFTAGALSFLSPCVLPLIPSYMSFITGMSLDEMGEHRGAAFTHALLFVSGFTLIFLMLGATASSVGRLLQFHQVWLERFGGVLIIFFGLYLLGVFRFGA